MLYRPFDNLQNNYFTENLQNSSLNETRQHGIHQNQQPQQQYLSRDGYDKHTLPASQDRKRSILLDVPPETLTSITSYLTPPALLSLGCVSSYLAHHVKEDNTWRRAFVCHFLGISPEADINIGNRSEGPNQIATGHDSTSANPWKTLLLRRVEGKTWRDEFAWRYVMINRWNRSKSTPITHIPTVHSNISSLHLMNIPSPAYSSYQAPSSTTVPSSTGTSPYVYPSTRFAAPALLSASNQYGIVARSLPLSGKVLTGYLDASTGARLGVAAFGGGNLNIGMGNMNGNPNAQFTPNVTSSDITSSIPPSQGEISSAHPTLGTAHVAWGMSAGDLIFTTAPRVMNANVNDGRGGRNGRSGAEVRRCRFGDEHEGAVRDVKWADNEAQEQAGRWVVSGGSDGRVKLWGAESAVCLWSSEVMHDRERLGTVPDPLVRVDSFFPSLLSDSSNHPQTKSTSGIIVAVGESGDIYAWVGLDNPGALGDGDSFDISNIKTIVIDCPFKPSTFYLDSVSAGRNTQTAFKVSALSIDPNFSQEGSGAHLRFLVAYENDPLFYRVTVGGHVQDHGQVEITTFGNPNFGPTSVVKPYFGRGAARGGGGVVDVGKNVGFGEASFVLVGDHVGCVSLYAWDIQSPTMIQQRGQYHQHPVPVAPLRTFEAHRDGASVTALWWDELVLVTGSARGTTHVWDGITFGHLRSFVSPVKRARGGRNGDEENERQRLMVRHIVVNRERDVVVVAVGDTVMAWHAGVLARGGRGHGHAGGGGGVRGRHTPGMGVPGKKRAGGAKFIGEYEMRQTILESRDLLEREAKETRRVYAREREHREGLEVLGLSEVEAVEYALMLSRDEANERARAEAVSLVEQEEGVFEGDFDEDEEDGNEDASVYGVSPSVSSSSSSSLASSASMSGSNSNSSLSTSGVSGVRSSLVRTGIPIASYTPRVGPSDSNEKVQISPPYRSEPKEAGEEYVVGVGGGGGADVELEEHHFPPIFGSVGVSPRSGEGVSGRTRVVEEEEGKGKGKERGKGKEKADTKDMGRSSKIGSGGMNTNTNISGFPARIPATTAGTSTPGGSPKSPKTNAWSVPMKPKAPSSSRPGVSSPLYSGGLTRAGGSSSGLGSGGGEEGMDEDLRFALELSLVEARSRGEDV